MKRVSLTRQLVVHHKPYGRNQNNYEWYFLILDKKEELDKLQERICALFHIKKAEHELRGRVRGSGLDYKRIDFKSSESVCVENLTSLSGRVRFDSRLYAGRDREGLERYISGIC